MSTSGTSAATAPASVAVNVPEYLPATITKISSGTGRNLVKLVTPRNRSDQAATAPLVAAGPAGANVDLSLWNDYLTAVRGAVAGGAPTFPPASSAPGWHQPSSLWSGTGAACPVVAGMRASSCSACFWK